MGKGKYTATASKILAISEHLPATSVEGMPETLTFIPRHAQLTNTAMPAQAQADGAGVARYQDSRADGVPATLDLRSGKSPAISIARGNNGDCWRQRCHEFRTRRREAAVMRHDNDVSRAQPLSLQQIVLGTRLDVARQQQRMPPNTNAQHA